ncbi:MAG: hypothetical protein PUP92_17625 [Rhizonema sp. PD38]|nr:hypothetical protein [Rhizonema sp. PD38]
MFKSWLRFLFSQSDGRALYHVRFNTFNNVCSQTVKSAEAHGQILSEGNQRPSGDARADARSSLTLTPVA